VDWSRWDIRGACGANPRIRNPAALLSSWSRSRSSGLDVRRVCLRVCSSWSANIAVPGDRVGGFAPYARHAITVERSSSRREHGSPRIRERDTFDVRRDRTLVRTRFVVNRFRMDAIFAAAVGDRFTRLSRKVR